MKHVVVVCLLAVLCFSSIAVASTRYSFVLEPGQVVPASGSAASGRGVATLKAYDTQLQFLIEHDVASPTSATVRLGDFGTNGPVAFSFSSAESSIFEVWALSPADVAALQAGQLYVEITSSAYPAGDIRGQIAPRQIPEPGDVIITEIMYHPASTEQTPSVAEWIELFNPSYSDIEIGGWFLQDEATEAGDPCVLRASGTIPAHVLRSGAVVVIIPDGGVPAATVADFRTAWGLSAVPSVLQLNADGTTGGALVVDSLADAPYNDGDDGNDLPLLVEPCDPGNPTPHPDVEVLTLNDGGQIIDKVNYDNASPWPEPAGRWPETNTAASITVVPADYPASLDTSTYSGSGNDNGANWILHTHSDEAGGRQQAVAAGVYGGKEVGSPGYLFGATGGNQPPTADPQAVLMQPGTQVDFNLTGHDNTRPFFGMLLFVITSLPDNGDLIHTPSGHVVTQQDIGTNGYLVPTTPFYMFRYVNDGSCGKTGFTFQTFDATLRSPDTEVSLIVQCGDVVITEIMYDPASTEGVPSMPEWVELYNTTASPIDLAGWYLEDDEGRCGDLPTYVLGAGQTLTVIPSAASDAEFLQAWSATSLRPTVITETTGGALTGWNLGNFGDELRLVKPGGTLPMVSDAVYYGNGGGWPNVSSDGPSIYLRGPTSQYTAYSNDSASAWGRSAVGTDLAYQNTVTGIYDGADIGSPGRLLGVCGDGHCEPSEDNCNCAADCGSPVAQEVSGSTCDDGLDNDCDAVTDCFDPDCYPDPVCIQGCCQPTQGTCTDLNPDQCFALGRIAIGPGNMCQGDGNGNGFDDACEGIPTLSEWGLMAMALLLLTAGAAVIARQRRGEPSG